MLCGQVMRIRCDPTGPLNVPDLLLLQRIPLPFQVLDQQVNAAVFQYVQQGDSYGFSNFKGRQAG